jgi:hypothetical protein
MWIKRITSLLALLAPLWTSAIAAPPATNAAPAGRVLIIDRSSTAVSGGKATLSIGPLKRAADIYAGDYQMKVSPYFFKGEKGRLAIVVSGESLARVTKGMKAEITGTATTNGKEGETRRIDATATPSDNNRGALKLWFIAGDRKIVFNTSYHFAENEPAAIPIKSKTR